LQGACRCESWRSLTRMLACAWQAAVLGDICTSVNRLTAMTGQMLNTHQAMSEWVFLYMHACLLWQTVIHYSTPTRQHTSTHQHANLNAHAHMNSHTQTHTRTKASTIHAHTRTKATCKRMTAMTGTADVQMGVPVHACLSARGKPCARQNQTNHLHHIHKNAHCHTQRDRHRQRRRQELVEVVCRVPEIVGVGGLLHSCFPARGKLCCRDYTRHQFTTMTGKAQNTNLPMSEWVFACMNDCLDVATDGAQQYPNMPTHTHTPTLPIKPICIQALAHTHTPNSTTNTHRLLHVIKTRRQTGRRA